MLKFIRTLLPGAKPKSLRSKKSCRIATQFCSFRFANNLRLFFNDHAFNRAMFNWARVINTHFLTSSQRGCHDFTSRINDSRSCAERETDRSLIAPDHNRLARLIGGYRAGGISCCGAFCCCCGFGRCRLLCCSRGLCKRQWCRQRTNQTNDCFLHSDSLLLMISFTPKFVTQGSNGRSFSVPCFDWFRRGDIRTIVVS